MGQIKRVKEGLKKVINKIETLEEVREKKICIGLYQGRYVLYICSMIKENNLRIGRLV
jgi:hypothetical protein